MLTDEVLVILEALERKSSVPPWEYRFVPCEEPHTIFGSVSVDGSQTSIFHSPWNRPNEEDTFNLVVLLRNHASDLIAAARRVAGWEEMSRRCHYLTDQVNELLEKAVLAEREACANEAKLMGDSAMMVRFVCHDPRERRELERRAELCDKIAEAIRNRSNQ